MSFWCDLGLSIIAGNETASYQFCKRISTVADGMLGVGVHLSEANVVTTRLKNRIVAKTSGAARWKLYGALDFTLDAHCMPIWPD